VFARLPDTVLPCGAVCGSVWQCVAVHDYQAEASSSLPAKEPSFVAHNCTFNVLPSTELFVCVCVYVRVCAFVCAYLRVCVWGGGGVGGGFVGVGCIVCVWEHARACKVVRFSQVRLMYFLLKGSSKNHKLPYVCRLFPQKIPTMSCPFAENNLQFTYPVGLVTMSCQRHYSCRTATHCNTLQHTCSSTVLPVHTETEIRQFTLRSGYKLHAP